MYQAYTWATFEAQFMKKLSNTEAELKKALVIKKAFTLKIHLSADLETYLEQLVKDKSLKTPALRKKCPYSELFWSLFSRIWTEYGAE